MRINMENPAAHHATAYLNDEKISHCFEADEEEGWVRCHVTDATDHVVFDPEHPGEPLTERRHGVVRLDFDPPVWRQVAEAAIALAAVAPNLELLVTVKGRK